MKNTIEELMQISVSVKQRLCEKGACHNRRTAKVQMSLHICAVSSEPSLLAQSRNEDSDNAQEIWPVG